MSLRAQLSILGLSDESLSALEPCSSDSRIHDPGDGDPPHGSQPRASTERQSRVTKQQLLSCMSLPLSLGGLGLHPVVSIRHAAYYAWLMQVLPVFAQPHPELLRDTSAMRQTQLHREVSACRKTLLRHGAPLCLACLAPASSALFALVSRAARPPPSLPVCPRRHGRPQCGRTMRRAR